MYLEHTKSKLGSTKAKVCTGRSEVVKRLHRKTGGSIKRSKHGIGGNVLGALAHFLPFAEGGKIQRAMGGITPSPAASKFAYKKGKRVKREHHMVGALLGAATAIPSIISLVNKLRK